MICRKFQATFRRVYFGPENCTKEFQQDKEYECLHAEGSGWIQAISSEENCQFPRSATKPLNCQIAFTNQTQCPPLANFWRTIGDGAVATRLAIVPLGAVYAFLVLFVLILTLWHTVDEVRFGECFCASCEAVPGPSMRHVQDSQPAYILSAQPVTSSSRNLHGENHLSTSTMNSIYDLASSSARDDDRTSNSNSSSMTWKQSREHQPHKSQLSTGVSWSKMSGREVDERTLVKQCFPASFLSEPFSWSYYSKVPAVELIKSGPIASDEVQF